MGDLLLKLGRSTLSNDPTEADAKEVVAAWAEIRDSFDDLVRNEVEGALLENSVNEPVLSCII